MKQYPHIEYCNKYFGETIYAFDKYDGSNLRFEWSKKQGWHKFGTRKMMINEQTEFFGNGITLFLNKYADDLETIFKSEKIYRNMRSTVVFAEYAGENSFAGFHDPNDVMDIILFDVDVFQRGLISAKEFLENFGHLHIPELIYHGNLNTTLIHEIKNNVYNLKEGVVCKGTRKTKGSELVWMGKIKTNAWLDRIKNKFGENALLKELNGEITIPIE